MSRTNRPSPRSARRDTNGTALSLKFEFEGNEVVGWTEAAVLASRQERSDGVLDDTRKER